MKAIRIHEYGGPDVLHYEDVPDPKPAEGEVRVRVHAAGVNPIDWKVRAGSMKRMVPLPLPWTPGVDFSGVTEDGREVFGKTDLPGQGSYAEYVTVKQSSIAPKPETVDHVHAAAVPLAGLTAWQALFGNGSQPGLDLRAGQTLLILGAGGGVGGFAVQLARWKGARVIGLVRPGQEAQVRELGAEPITDLGAAGTVDAVLDLLGGDVAARAWPHVARGGSFASTLGTPSAEEAAARGARTVAVLTKTNGEQLAQIGALLGARRLRAEVTRTLPLASAREAQEMLENGGVTGKVVLEVG
jgi:NADPH:quinone reductase-like Zn-dependent oxidoreductase